MIMTKLSGPAVETIFLTLLVIKDEQTEERQRRQPYYMYLAQNRLIYNV